jgi:hypothetical protein
LLHAGFWWLAFDDNGNRQSRSHDKANIKVAVRPEFWTILAQWYPRSANAS